MKLTAVSYLSPVLRYDYDAKVVVIQHRDTDTGQVARQFPSEERVRDMRRDVLTGADRPAPAEPTEKAKTAGTEPGSGRVSLTV
jgi:hypothetical protein